MENGVKTTGKTFELEQFVRQFEDSATESQTEREHAEVYRDYLDGKQYTDEEINKLVARGQPVITDNRIRDKVEYLLGMERQTRTDPKAFPRNPTDTRAGELATDALRYVADCNHFNQVKSQVAETLWVEGMGGCEVVVEQDPRGGNPKIRQRFIRWDRIYRDPHSMLADFSDAEYMGVVIWMDLERAKRKYAKVADQFDALFSTGPTGYGGETYDDKPSLWVDRTRRRVRIFEHYFRDGGTWHRCVFMKGAFIEEPAPSPYLDEYGAPECPIILQSCYVERKGNRYGVVRRYKDLQDEINKRRSKALHLLSVNQIIADKGAVDDVDKARKEAARPDGYIEKAPGVEFEINRNTELANGQFQLLQEAIAAMGATGPNAALQGQSGQVSGRAKEIDAQGGAVQLGILFDSLRHWQKRVHIATWNRIKQFWTQAQWIRVTDNEGEPKYVGLNMVTQDQPEPIVVGELDVDIIIDEAPDVVTLQSEQWMQLTELASKGVPIPPDVLLNASSLRNKKELVDRMTNGGKVPPEVQQMLAQKEQEFAEAQQMLQEAAAKVVQEKQAVEAEKQAVTNERTAIKSEVAMLNARKVEIGALEKALGAHAQAAQSQIDTANTASKTSENAQAVLPQIAEMLTVSAQQQAALSAQIAEAMSAVAQALAAPKLVELNKGADGRPVSATVTPVVN